MENKEGRTPGTTGGTGTGGTREVKRTLNEGASEVKRTAQTESGDVKAAAGELGAETRDAARAVARTAAEQAGRVGGVVKQQSTVLADQARMGLQGRAEGLKTGLAQSLDHAAVMVRERATEMNRDQLGMKVAQPLERSADYLRTTPIEQMPTDLNRTITRSPMQSVVVAFGIGFVLGLILKKR